MRVLIVDDCEMIRTVLSKMCEHVLGSERVCVTNEDDAFILFKNMEFDLVLTDMQMKSNFGGQILCGQIKEISDCPVVLITSNVRNIPFPEKFDEILEKQYIVTNKNFLLKYKTEKIMGASAK